MKFLVDQQLPVALAQFLKSHGYETEHVRNIGLKDAADSIVWNHAVSRGMIVISKDEDFVYLAKGPGMSGQLVWVRLGNCRNEKLIQTFTDQLPEIIAALETGGSIIELR